MHCAIPVAGTRLEQALRKRYTPQLRPELVTQFPRFELESQFWRAVSNAEFGRRVYAINGAFDRRVARELETVACDVFIGYETSSLHCLEFCRSRGIAGILDQGQVHFNRHHFLSEAGFDPMFGDRETETRVEEVKAAELDLARLVLVPSSLSRAALLDAKVPEQKIRLVPYGYDPDVFFPKTAYRASGPLRIVYAGALTRRKGLTFLMDALRALDTASIEVTLIGGDADASGLIGRDTPSWLRRIPFTLPNGLRALFQEADVLVLPSLLDSFGLVALEAMACGTPAIVSDRTGAADLVENGTHGFVVPAANADKLCEAILHLARDRGEARRMGQNAALQAQLYTWEHHHRKVRETIRSQCVVAA
ncbi:MAG: glycosyltransferase family 4 protein [Acidobacteriota bacterium]